MPLFEYRCKACGRKFAHLVGVTADSSAPVCPRCGGNEVTKLVSRFSRLRSEDERLDSMEDAALAGDIESPAGVKRWMREMGEEMGEDAGEDFNELAEEAEREVLDGEEE